ncbi:MAG: phosphate/phosphite/phosphonate ABC transporter substrate-binding protein [Archangium sp.]|nr:phosphate/phosphite/phosphonate ABC transporter substrate-binding protein [Archangium sp.]
MNSREIILLIFLLASTACTEPEEVLPEPVPRISPALPVFSPPSGFTKLRFGLVPFLSKETIAAAHHKLADHLSKTLSVPVEIVVADSYADAIDRMERGEFDLVELSPMVYVDASKRMKMKCLVQTIADGSATASGYIFVRDDSPRRSIEDLKGGTFAFVDPMSTSGSVLPKKVLRDKGIDWTKDFTRTEYLGNHEAVLLAVLEGRADAGATYQGSFGALRRSKGVDPLSFRVIAKTPRTPRDIFCVNPAMSAEISDALSASMLSLTGRDRAGREILGPLNLNGFRPADDRNYDELRAIAAEIGK